MMCLHLLPKTPSKLCNTPYHPVIHGNTLRHTVTHCNTSVEKVFQSYEVPALQHTVLQHTVLQHTATHCNTLQHAATHAQRKCFSLMTCLRLLPRTLSKLTCDPMPQQSEHQRIFFTNYTCTQGILASQLEFRLSTVWDTFLGPV